MSRYDLTDFEWRVIEPLLPDKPRGVSRVNDRRVLNGIFWMLRSGAPWRDLPERYGPRTTCYNRFVRWRKAGLWGASLRDRGAFANIPPKANRRWKPYFSTRLYRERNLIELYFSKLKHFRRVATRYDKLACNFLAMVQLA